MHATHARCLLVGNAVFKCALRVISSGLAMLMRNATVCACTYADVAPPLQAHILDDVFEGVF